MQRQIRTPFDRIVKQYEVGARWHRLELPVSVKVASARKPATSR